MGRREPLLPTGRPVSQPCVSDGFGDDRSPDLGPSDRPGLRRAVVSWAWPAQAHGGRSLHPAHVESRHAGTDGLQGVVVEMVRRGPWGRGDGLRHDCLVFRRKQGRRRPVCGSTAEAIVSIHGMSSAQAGHEAGLDADDCRRVGFRGHGAMLRTSPVRVAILAPLPPSLFWHRRRTRRRQGRRHGLRQLVCETFHAGGVVEMPIMNVWIIKGFLQRPVVSAWFPNASQLQFAGRGFAAALADGLAGQAEQRGCLAVAAVDELQRKEAAKEGALRRRPRRPRPASGRAGVEVRLLRPYGASEPPSGARGGYGQASRRPSESRSGHGRAVRRGQAREAMVKTPRKASSSRGQ